MTYKELEKKLNEVLEKNTSVMTTSSGRVINDNERLHIDADNLLVEALRSLWYTKSADKYDEIAKEYFWYA